MSTALEFYLQFGLIWTGFSLGCQTCLRSGAGFRPLALARCVVFNLALWPLALALVGVVLHRRRQALKKFSPTTASGRRRRHHKR